MKSVTPERFSNNIISNIRGGILYYVYTGRNAWHSTWIKQYESNCMHNSLISAKQHAEKRRERGTVLYIEMIPCLAVCSGNEFSVITEINYQFPMTDHGISVSKDVSIKEFCQYFANSTKYCTSIGPTKRDFLFFTFEKPYPLIEDFQIDNMFHFKSYSEGVDYHLGWSKIEMRFNYTKFSKLLENYKREAPD